MSLLNRVKSAQHLSIDEKKILYLLNSKPMSTCQIIDLMAGEALTPRSGVINALNGLREKRLLEIHHFQSNRNKTDVYFTFAMDWVCKL